MELKDKNFYTSRSLALTTVNDGDASNGFWMAYIDNKRKKHPEVKCMRFDQAIMDKIYSDHIEHYQGHSPDEIKHTS